MKKSIIISLAVVVIFAFATPLIAQDATVNTSRSNIKNLKAGTDSPPVCVGKIRCADGSCTINFDQQIVSPRDAASGLPTGKRQHKPFVITKELDKSTPMLRESPTKQSSGKASMSDLSVMISVKGKTSKLPVVNNQITLPEGVDDDCDLVVSWSWGETNAGSSKNYQATFSLTAEKGVYMESKHTKTGHVTLMK